MILNMFNGIVICEIFLESDRNIFVRILKIFYNFWVNNFIFENLFFNKGKKLYLRSFLL